MVDFALSERLILRDAAVLLSDVESKMSFDVVDEVGWHTDVVGYHSPLSNGFGYLTHNCLDRSRRYAGRFATVNEGVESEIIAQARQ
ncbi:hypothetical protein SPHINGO8AM_30198 [Sphingomonas sp. 8AM]|nr:hypothetical protein SPHINGO8AM_30198 [Sphingomonas sp. 8AM]